MHILMSIFKRLFPLTCELAFLSGLILQYHSFFAPLPWRGGLADSSIYFIPYNQPHKAPLGDCSALVRRSHASAEDGQISKVRRVMRIEGLAKRDGNSSQSQASNVAVWIGPLGSCSRDDDGRTFCTKPSYSNPQYNLSHIDPAYQSKTMVDKMPRRARMILATIILNTMAFVLSFPIWLIYWFPTTYTQIFGANNNHRAGTFAVWVCIALMPSTFVQFGLILFQIESPEKGDYNLLDTFYFPAACGVARQLKPGVLLKEVDGNGYKYLWAGWVLVNLYASLLMIPRAFYLHKYMGKGPDRYQEARDKEHKSARKAAQALKDAQAREMEKFRKEVEKERIRIEAAESKRIAKSISSEVEVDKTDLEEKPTPPTRIYKHWWSFTRRPESDQGPVTEPELSV